MIVGLSGKKRHGKDTIAEALEDEGFTILRFSQPIKDTLLLLNPIVYFDKVSGQTVRYAQLVEWFGPDKAKDCPEVRLLQKRMGTEAGREGPLGADVWVHAFEQQLEDGVNYVIADVRFLNEAALVRRHGGEIWRVNRPGFDDGDNHDSETQLDDYPFDRVFTNAGPVEQLQTLARDCAREAMLNRALAPSAASNASDGSAATRIRVLP